MSRGLLDSITEVFRPQVPLYACELTSRHAIVGGVSKHRDQIAARVASELPAGAVVPSQHETNIRNLEATRSTVRDLLHQAAVKGSEIVVVVPDDTSRVAFLTTDKTAKNHDEQRTFIRWKLKKSVPFDVDSAQVAFQVLGPHSSGIGTDLLVALSPRSVVQEYENLFDSMDLHAGLVIPSTLAALNLLQPSVSDSLFLKIGAECITTTVFQNRRLHFYRRVTDVSLYDAVYPTILYYQDKLGGKAIERFVVCGYDTEMRDQVAEVQEKLELPAQRLEPKSVDDIYKPVLGAVNLISDRVL